MALSSPLNVLVLGATGFIGPHVVAAAVARGHRVSVLTRGRPAADLPEPVERLVGHRPDDLASIRHRGWDVVLDLAAYAPGWVRSLGEAIGDNVGHYAFVSTIMVYDFAKARPPYAEDSALIAYDSSIDPFERAGWPVDLAHYGSLKALCEREARDQFAGRCLIIRPGYIVGPGDRQGYFLYWPARMQHGGAMLVVGEPDAPVQFIDVRDLATWTVQAVERSITGTFNLAGPASAWRFEQLIEINRRMARHAVEPIWMPPRSFAGQDDIWAKMLMWSRAGAEDGGLFCIDNRKALVAGLNLRPVGETISDSFNWFCREPVSSRSALLGLKPQDGGAMTELRRIERQILTTWSGGRP